MTRLTSDKTGGLGEVLAAVQLSIFKFCRHRVF